MGELRAFLDIKRKDPGYRPRDQRLRDYNAVEREFSQEETCVQAARCMDCGTPFCHAFGCPVGNIIPEFNNLVYRKRWEEALAILLSTNNFPEFTGRICPAPCESACVAGLSADPVAIRQIELAIVEKGFESGYMSPGPNRRSMDRSVAVIGSGPAGLAVADTLSREGYGVTVYESDRQPGGLLMYGIPDFKLEKWVVRRRIDLMKEQGVIFETDINAGEDISPRFLKKRFDAVCLACGAREPRDLEVPGRDLQGIFFAMDYLVQQNKRLAGEKVEKRGEISAKDKTVVIIGGGDTGSDCLGTALRQGAKKAYLFEILPQPPSERPDETPWPMWPVVFRKTHAHEEGGELRWSVMTKEFLGRDGVLKGLRCAEVEWAIPEKGGPPVPREKAGTEFEVEADLVLLSLGFIGHGNESLVQGFGLEVDGSGRAGAGRERRTGEEGVFVSGDMRQGQSLVVKAIADGRRTAREVMLFLQTGA